MKTRIQKWSHSLALRIPRVFADEVGLSADSLVEMTVADGQLLIAPVTGPAINLDELLAQITEDNLHGEVATDDPIGNEGW